MSKKLRRFRDFTVIMTVALAPFTLLGLETAIGAGVVWASMVVVAAVVVPLGPETDEEWLEPIRRPEGLEGLCALAELAALAIILGIFWLVWVAGEYQWAAVVVLSAILVGMVIRRGWGGGNPNHKDHNPTGGWSDFEKARLGRTSPSASTGWGRRASRARPAAGGAATSLPGLHKFKKPAGRGPPAGGERIQGPR